MSRFNVIVAIDLRKYVVADILLGLRLRGNVLGYLLLLLSSA